MDFLEEVDIDSLSEAIDFVENFEAKEGGFIDLNTTNQGQLEYVGSSNSLPVRTQSKLSSSQQTNTPSNSSPTKKKRKCEQGYSTKLLRRKKAELHQLRKEEQNLRAWLDQLKNVMKDTKLSSEHEEPSKQENTKRKEWMAKALDEFQRRRRAEAVNRKLKAIQADQVKIHESLLEIIQHGPALKDKLFVFGDPLTPRRSFTIYETHESTSIIGELKGETKSLFQHLKGLAPQQKSNQFASSLETKSDSQHGKMFESSTTSFVSCSMKSASDTLWIEYSTPRKVENKSYRYMNSVDKNSVRKSFDLLLHSRCGRMPINGLMFAQKFEETEQVTMVRAYMVILPTAGLHIRYNHWTIVTPSSHGCFVRFFVQLYTESEKGFNAVPADVEYVHEAALLA